MAASSLSFLSKDQLRSLSKHGREKEIFRPGEHVYSSKKEHDARKWHYILSGRLRVKLDMTSALNNSSESETVELSSGEIFGGFGVSKYEGVISHIVIETVEATKFLELSGAALEEFVQKHEVAGKKLMARMGESTWTFLSGDRFLGDIDESEVKDRMEESNTKGSSSRLSEWQLHQLKKGFTLIESLWGDFSLGTNQVSVTQFQSVHKYLKEIGKDLFEDIFLKQDLPSQVSKSDFWFCVMKYFEISHAQTDPNDNVEPAPALLLLDPEEEDLKDGDDEEDLDEEEEPPGCLETLHANFAPSRRLKNLFFDEERLERYESSFLAVSGDIKKPIARKHIPRFLELLFPEFSYRISPYNVNELLDVFGKNGANSKHLFWPDIRKVLRERKNASEVNKNRMIVNSTFNPESLFVRMWHRFMRLVAAYYIVMIPVRIAFKPWESMVDVKALATDLSIDLLTIVNFFIRLNTFYTNSKAVVVTDRAKILRRLNISHFLAALPIDWAAHFCGASLQICVWLRLPKMYMAFRVMNRSRSIGGSKSVLSTIFLLVAIVALISHFSACGWFYIGVNYLDWYPGRGITWYTYEPDLLNHTHIDYGKFGMRPGSTVWEQYVLSFYWICATLSGNGLIGDEMPQNNVEIVYTILIMILSLTFFRYLTVEVSTMVMKADEETVEFRARLETVESLLQDDHILPEVKNEIRQHFNASKSSTTIDMSAVYSLVSHSLQVEIASFVARECLDSVPLFHGCDERFLDAVSVLLREVQFGPEEYLFRETEMAEEMFFVVAGSVEELVENGQPGAALAEPKVVQAGAAVGDVAFFFAMRHVVSARCHKITGATCLRLARDQFMPLLKQFPEEEETIAEGALKMFEIRTGGKGPGSQAGRSMTSFTKSMEEVSQSHDHRSRVDSGGDSDSEMNKVFGSGMLQRIAAIRLHRHEEGVHKILSAAARGDLAELKALLKNQPTVSVRDSLNRTPLHVAACEGQKETVIYLLKSSADINIKDSFQNTCLNDAVRQGHDGIAALLRESGSVLNYPGKQAGVLLCQAAYAGKLDEVKRFVSNGVSPSASDYDQRTPLHLAACEGHLEMVEYLIDKKADINSRDRFGGSALDDAVRHGHKEIQKLLRSKGATLDVMSSALKMCEYAARGDLDSIKVLVENGVDCAIGDYDRRTAMHLAASEGKISILDFLISEGVEVNPMDRMGGTPAEDAKRHGKKTATMLLRHHGGLEADDPKLKELVEAQEVAHAQQQRALRGGAVSAACQEAREARGWAVVRGSYLPGLHASLAEAAARAEDLRGCVAGGSKCPALRRVVEQLAASSAAAAAQRRSSFRSMVTGSELQGVQVVQEIEALTKASGVFYGAVSTALDAIAADFPRFRSLQLVARPLLLEISVLRRNLMLCLDFKKKTKRALKELRSQAHSTTNRRDSTESMASEANSRHTSPLGAARPWAERKVSTVRAPGAGGGGGGGGGGYALDRKASRMSLGGL